jgi:hypothetical protein
MACACRCHSRRLVQRVPWSEVRAAGLTLISLAAALFDKLQ